MKLKKPKEDKKDREGKRRPFQDDTMLIVAAAVILIVAQYYYMVLRQELSRPKKVVVRVDGDDVAHAVNQDLAGQRDNIESHIKNFLYIPHDKTDDALMARYKPFFSAQGWAQYQNYVAATQKALGRGQALRGEFIFGSQKYVMIDDDLTGFRAEGLFCFGQDTRFKCGPQGFSMQAVLRGNVNKPGALQFEEWQVLPPASARMP